MHLNIDTACVPGMILTGALERKSSSDVQSKGVGRAITKIKATSTITYLHAPLHLPPTKIRFTGGRCIKSDTACRLLL